MRKWFARSLFSLQRKSLQRKERAFNCCASLISLLSLTSFISFIFFIFFSCETFFCATMIAFSRKSTHKCAIRLFSSLSKEKIQIACRIFFLRVCIFSSLPKEKIQIAEKSPSMRFSSLFFYPFFPKKRYK